MFDNAQDYLKFLLGCALGIVLIWIGITGRLGSLLGAILTPSYMVQGHVAAAAVSGLETSDPNATNVTSSSTLSALQIGSFAYQAGVTSQQALTTAIAIALAESRGKVGAHNPGNGTTDIEDSWGLWQINVLAWKQFDKKKLVTPSYNATAMYIVSGGGVNWLPWGTYTGGQYRNYLNQASQAAATVIQNNAGK